MPRLPAIVAAIFFLVSTAQGRIGETEKEIQAHYGEPITALPSRAKDAGVTKCYASQGYLIAVTYLHGQSVREMLTKADNSKMTEREIQKLLDANGKVWNELRVHSSKKTAVGVQQWRTSDYRSRVAIYDGQTHALFITTQNFIDLTNAKTRDLRIRDAKRELFGPGGRMRNSDILGNGGSLPGGGYGQEKPGASPAK